MTRYFDTGATRDTEKDKLDYEGFLSPHVLETYAYYMNEHRKQADGNLRDSDNWQKGIPLSVYMKSAWRHFIEWWILHRTGYGRHPKLIMTALCALLFNVMGYMHEIIQKELNNEGSTPDREV